MGIALDTGVSPPILYVSDSGNNRVLAWRNAASFNNGAPADLVIGQRDMYSTLPQGPGTTLSTGLSNPTGLAVRDGDLYIADSGNNRVLRFSKPFNQADLFPDLVVGQTSFNSRTANAGGLSAQSLSLANRRTYLAFDGSGSLYVTDPGNRRVLRFSAAALSANGPRANLVIGQADFSTAAPFTGSTQNLQIKDRLVIPTGLALDSRGSLYVGDYDPDRPNVYSRVLVFDRESLTQNGAAASRVLGALFGAVPPPQETIDRTVMLGPEGLALINDGLAVADALSNRILLFAPRDQWPPESSTFSPPAHTVIGQAGFSSRSVNRGQPESAADRLALPFGLAAIAGELFVADTGNNRVLVFAAPYSSTSAASRVLGQVVFTSNAVNMIEGREVRFTATGSSGLQAEAGLALDLRGDTPHLYIADTFNHRVLGFRDARRVRAGDRADLVIGQPDMLRALCNFPSGNVDSPRGNTLCAPTAVAVDENGNLYVADTGNSRVLRFPAPFERLESMPAADLVLGQTSFTLRITDATTRTMSSPSGVAVTPSGILVSDSAHNRVLLFPGTANTLTSGMSASRVFGQPNFTSIASSSLQNRMNTPRQIAVDAAERLYVADSVNNRVLIFAPVSQPGGDVPASLVITAGTSGTTLQSPRSVFVHGATGDIWVADTNGARVLRYGPFERISGTNPTATSNIPAVNPISLAFDSAGTLFLADTTNRVAIHFPALAGVNSANYLAGRPLSPGAIASIFPLGIQFGSETSNFDQLPNPLPLPRELAGIEVLVNGQAVPLFFVSPGQINFQMPFQIAPSGTADIIVQRRASGQVLAAGIVQMNEVSPAMFTLPASGSGQVAAINEDGSVNTATNPARPGSVVSLYGTGQGRVAGGPATGEAATGIIATDEKPRVLLNNVALNPDNVLFSGLAPGFVGLWQINVRIPETQPAGSVIPVSVQLKGVPSNNPQNPNQVRATIAIRP